MAQGRRVKHQRVIKQLARLFGGCHCDAVLECGEHPPALLQAWQQQGQRAAPMAEADAQARAALDQAAGQHRGCRQTHVARIGQHLLQRRGAHQSLHACGPDGVHKYRRAHGLAGFEKRVKFGRTNRAAVDVAAHLDAGKAQRLHCVLQLANGQVHVLQGHRAHAHQTAA